MKLMRLIYASFHGGIGVKAMGDILTVSRRHNQRDGITGALFYNDENFLQLLEGDRRKVTDCCMRIMLDPRHQDIQIIFAEDEPKRMFEDWDMFAIKTSQVDRKVLAQSLVEGTFDPSEISSAAGVEIYQSLSVNISPKVDHSPASNSPGICRVDPADDQRHSKLSAPQNADLAALQRSTT